jgi:sortase A
VKALTSAKALSPGLQKSPLSHPIWGIIHLGKNLREEGFDFTGKGTKVARRRSPEDLTVDELRQLLIQKRRSERQKRLDHYRRSGRVILVESVPNQPSFDAMEVEPLLEEETSARPQPRSRVWLDRLLFLVEVAAVIGLAYVIFNGLSVMRNLNQQVAAVLEHPTPSPTPLISAVVLPSGHTPPQNGVTRFNEGEIPEHLRPLVQAAQVEIALPTPSPKNAARIKIPTINVFARVVQGDGWEQLKQGVAQHIGSPDPGENGNIVLSAHNDVFGQLFRDLDKLKPGDEVVLYTEQKTFTYVVRQTQIVEPTQVEVMAPTRDPVLTLISCYPYLVDDKRIVVTASLASGN